jgi:nuclear RNA export factor
MAKIPATKHEISGPPENFCLDAFPVALGPESMGLMINVHGQFAECEQ